MHLSTLVYLVILSLSISSIHGRNHYLDNLGLLDTLPVDQTDDQPKPSEKSYLERLEEKTIYENELNKLEDLLASNNQQLAAGPMDDSEDEYLRSSNVYPAFNSKELNEQQPTDLDDELKNADQADNENSQISPADEMRNLKHYLTTMPTDLKNRLLSGPKLRRTWKKDPNMYYNPSIGAIYTVDEGENGNDEEAYRRIEQQQQRLERERKDEQENEANRKRLASLEGNLNKEVDLEEFTKYLMAKRDQLENKEKNSKSSSSSKSSASSSSNSGKESDSSKEDSKESKESKESNETGEATKETLQPNSNYSTEFKKTITAEQDGQTIEKVESYKKSVHRSDKQDLIAKLLEDQSDLRFINEPSKANYEKMLHQADLQGPIMIKQRKSLDSSYGGHLKSRFYSFSDIYFIGIVVACSMVSILSVIGAGYCFYRFQQHNKATRDVDYPAYGVIGPAFKSSQDEDPNSPKAKKNALTQESLVNKASNINHQSILSQDAGSTGSDRKLAQSAQLYHYHHQKQQMISSEKNKNCRTSASDVESDEENEEGVYTVFECPGLAANLGEIEITNPNFQHENVDTPTNEAKK